MKQNLTVFVFNRRKANSLHQVSPIKASQLLNKNKPHPFFKDGVFRIILQTNNIKLKGAKCYTLFTADKNFNSGIDPGLTNATSALVTKCRLKVISLDETLTYYDSGPQDNTFTSPLLDSDVTWLTGTDSPPNGEELRIRLEHTIDGVTKQHDNFVKAITI